MDLAADATLLIEREEYLATLADFTQEFAPATPFETRLVERLAQ